MITQTNYNMQMEMTLEGILEENISQKPRKPLVFQPYTNRQSMMIPDIESFIPEHHVARLVMKWWNPFQITCYFPIM